MIGRNILEEDTQLKRYATTPNDQKPRFNWGDYVQSQAEADAQPLSLKIEVGSQVSDYSIVQHLKRTFTVGSRSIVLAQRSRITRWTSCPQRWIRPLT